MTEIVEARLMADDDTQLCKCRYDGASIDLAIDSNVKIFVERVVRTRSGNIDLDFEFGHRVCGSLMKMV